MTIASIVVFKNNNESTPLPPGNFGRTNTQILKTKLKHHRLRSSATGHTKHNTETWCTRAIMRQSRTTGKSFCFYPPLVIRRLQLPRRPEDILFGPKKTKSTILCARARVCVCVYVSMCVYTYMLV